MISFCKKSTTALELYKLKIKIPRNELSKKVVTVFDQTEILMTAEKVPNKVLYGGHPDATGCKLWGEALYEHLIANVDIFKVN